MTTTTKGDVAQASFGHVSKLKTPQEIIHIKHKISLQQYKYWVLLLQELKANFDAGTPPDEDGFYSMRMADLSALLGYTPKKSEVWADLHALKNETIAFNALGKDGEQEKYGAGFISEWKVSNSFVRFKFPSFLEKVMRGLDAPKAMFALLNWNVFNHFTGKYEAIIYKLCKDYVGVGKTPKQTIEQFREYMGIKESEYREFMRLNEKVIKEPVKRINSSDVSDIEVFPEFQKQGRKIVSLYFRIEHKRQQQIPIPISDDDSPFRFAREPINPRLQAKYLSLRPQPEIMLCIERANEYAEQQAKSTGKPINYGGLYRKAITEGWHEQYATKKAQEAEKQARKEAELKQQADSTKAEEEAQKHAAAAKKERLERFEKMDDDEKEKLKEIFLSKATPTEKSSFAKNGYKSGLFQAFLVTHLP